VCTGAKAPEACLIYGEAGNDLVEAGDLADTVYGGDGDDNLKGFVGNDLMYGGADYDTIDGGSGDDTIRGETGGDCISGGEGSDTLYGDAGNDTLIATGDGGFADVLDGGADTDCASIDFGIDLASNIEGFYP
jgi:Ca2+-binding RTX toxin-like protein